MTTPKNAAAPGMSTEGGAEDQQGRADGFSLPNGSETFCNPHQMGRMFCGCKYEGPPRRFDCLDCDKPTRNIERRCDRCLDALVQGLRRRADALARLEPLETAVGGGRAW